MISIILLFTILYVVPTEARTLYWDRTPDWTLTSTVSYYNIRGCAGCTADITSPIIGTVGQVPNGSVPSFVLPDSFSMSSSNTATVTAVDNLGQESGISNVVSMGPNVLPTPTGFTISTNSSGTYTINWTRDDADNLIWTYFYICEYSGCIPNVKSARYQNFPYPPSGVIPFFVTPLALGGGVLRVAIVSQDGSISQLSDPITFGVGLPPPPPLIIPSAPLNPSLYP